MLNSRFYSELGSLLYAIALSDGGIQPRELSLLEREAEKALHHSALENKSIAVSKLRFYHCLDNNVPVKEALATFTQFLSKYCIRMTQMEKDSLIDLLHRISIAFGGETVAEAAVIAQVKKVLKQE